MTIKEWWELVDDSWDDLIYLIEMFHPACRSDMNMMKYPITAEMPEKACASIRRDVVEEYNPFFSKKKLPISTAITCRANKDISGLISVLNQTWFGMPESTDVHREPGFNELCDLCEGPYEEEQEDVEDKAF
jgi:hypothetical protein